VDISVLITLRLKKMFLNVFSPKKRALLALLHCEFRRSQFRFCGPPWRIFSSKGLTTLQEGKVKRI